MVTPAVTCARVVVMAVPVALVAREQKAETRCARRNQHTPGGGKRCPLPPRPPHTHLVVMHNGRCESLLGRVIVAGHDVHAG